MADLRGGVLAIPEGQFIQALDGDGVATPTDIDTGHFTRCTVERSSLLALRLGQPQEHVLEGLHVAIALIFMR